MHIQDKESLCLTERQADFVYKVVEKGNMINTKTMTNKMTQYQDDNPYKRVVLNNVYKVPERCLEMKDWSIFSDNIMYVQHDQMMTQNMNFDTLDYRNHKGLYLQLKNKKSET